MNNPYLDLTLADRLRNYAAACGPVTIHARNPGTLGYLAGAKVSVIDMLGLTDAFIAHLPKERLLAKRPRVGHPDKLIPLSYLARRGDIAFIEGWRKAVSTQSCGFMRLPAAYRDSDEDFVRHQFYPQRPGSP